jgi:hypothetical protein
MATEGTLRPLAKALVIWLMLMAAETVHGALREAFLSPLLGFKARQVAVVSGSMLILAITYFTIEWLGLHRTTDLLTVGLLWTALTVGFEFGIGVALGLPRQRILEDYNLSQGGLMLFGLAVLALAPLAAFRLRRSRSSS